VIPTYFTTAELAEHLRFVDASGALDLKRTHAYISRHLPDGAVKYRGRTLLIERAAVEAALDGRT
jgi:hypothetical protein